MINAVKNKAMMQTLVDLECKLEKWKEEHEIVQVRPSNAGLLLSREVQISVVKEKGPEREGKRGVLLNYDPQTQACFIRLFNYPFGFWVPLVTKEQPSDFRIIVNLKRGFVSSRAIEGLDA